MCYLNPQFCFYIFKKEKVFKSLLLFKKRQKKKRSSLLYTTSIIAQWEGVITSHNTGELQNIQAAYKLNGKNYLKWS